MAKSMKGVAAGAAAVFAISMASGPGIAVSSADHGRGGPSAGPEGGLGPRGPGHHGHDARSDVHRADSQDRRHDRSDGDRGLGGGTDGPGRRGPGRDHWQGSGGRHDGWGRGGGGDGWGRGGGGDDGGQATGGTTGRGTSSVAAVQPATATVRPAATVAPAASRGVTAAVAPASSTPATEPVGVEPPSVSPFVTAPAGGGGVGSVGAVVPTTLSPLVIFGDGRSPAYLPPPPARDVAAPAVGPVGIEAPAPVRRELAPAAPVTIPMPAPPATMTVVPWPLADTPVPSMWRHVQPGWPAGALFGIAGLLLAPIGGIWLGLRQARATKAASQLVGR